MAEAPRPKKAKREVEPEFGQRCANKIDALARDYRKPSETRSVQATFSSDSRRLLCALTHSFTAALLTSGANAALLSQYSREMDTAPCSALGLSLLPPSPCVTLGGLCVCDPLSVPTPFRPSALTPSEDAAPTLPPPALVHTVTLRDRHVPALFPPAVPTASSKEAKPKPVKVKPPA